MIRILQMVPIDVTKTTQVALLAALLVALLVALQVALLVVMQLAQQVAQQAQDNLFYIRTDCAQSKRIS